MYTHHILGDIDKIQQQHHHHSTVSVLAGSESIKIYVNMHQRKRSTKKRSALKTCLLVGLRPQDSRTLCDPTTRPFITDNACSAQALIQNTSTLENLIIKGRKERAKETEIYTSGEWGCRDVTCQQIEQNHISCQLVSSHELVHQKCQKLVSTSHHQHSDPSPQQISALKRVMSQYHCQEMFNVNYRRNYPLLCYLDQPRLDFLECLGRQLQMTIT